MKHEQVQELLEKGLLVSPELFKENLDFSNLAAFDNAEGPVVLNKTFFQLFTKKQNTKELNWLEFERAIAFKEKGRNTKTYDTFLELINVEHNPIIKRQLATLLQEIKQEVPLTKQELTPEPLPTVVQPDQYPVIVLKTFKEDLKKREASDFSTHLRNRYQGLRKLLSGRTELQEGLTSINKLKNKEEREITSIIGIVYDKRTTKNGHMELWLEDITGSIKVLITKDRREAFERAKDIALDEVVGVKGTMGKNVIFANTVLYPDIPKDHPLKKGPEDIYAAFISDIHVGSKKFLEKEFLNFINWINGNGPTPEDKIKANKIKYLFVVGDMIDGVGVYPGQETELAIPDIVKQYERAAELFGMIRKDLKIIIIPGQHDAIRNSEPQPPISKDYAPRFFDYPNILLVGNPTFLNIGATKEFEGITVLMYHGASFHYFIDNIDSLRLGKARDHPDILMKFLLQKRHLAVSHAATVYVPSINEDPMIIDPVPDIFCCGDMHRSAIATYNNVQTINGSCWQAKTNFQEKTGNNPDFCRVPIINLQTRAIEILKFDPNDH
ncbi:MAG: hypothetical protein Q7R96_02275 [Nanoarchaeota archaeon]|nr:hypothetical protein [Nanoarchaeota archaeon]